MYVNQFLLCLYYFNNFLQVVQAARIGLMDNVETSGERSLGMLIKLNQCPGQLASGSLAGAESCYTATAVSKGQLRDDRNAS